MKKNHFKHHGFNILCVLIIWEGVIKQVVHCIMTLSFMVGSTLKLKTSLPKSRISHLDLVCYFMEHAIHKCTYNTLDVTHT
jgi:hypothetical protein